jgi:hypothetical protein
MKLAIKLFLFSIFAVFSIFIGNQVSAETEISRPVILEVKKMGGKYLNRPLITGLTPHKTEVLVYLNGEFSGLAHVNASATQTDNFYYQPVAPLSSGEYEVSVIARDKTSLVLSAPSQIASFKIFDLSAPTLVAPNQDTVTAKVKPFITGLTRTDTRVHIFIDGVYNGKTDFVQSDNETADFFYKPFLNLSVGEHNVWAIAEDRAGKKSIQSQVVRFKIEEPYPAPVLNNPQSGSRFDKPIISGVAKNDSLIRLFIDKVLFGEFKVENDISGTASFSYVPFVALSPGDHLIFASAVDERGKESAWSNIVYYRVVAPEDQSSDLLGDSALINDLEDAEDEPEVLGEEGTDVEGVISESGVVEEIQDIINASSTDNGETSGAINEDRENQGKLKLNLAIFIIFLLSVIAWIFWVNRELIKERQEKTKSEK